MAVRISQTPRGRTDQGNFDALVRQEMQRLGQRGGEDRSQEARDRVAKRLNRQEGLGRTSSAYRPAAPAGTASRGRKSKSSGGGGKPPRGPSTALPNETDVVPTDKPTPDDDGGWPGWLLPLLAVASKKGQDIMGSLRNKAATLEPVEGQRLLTDQRVKSIPITGEDNIIDADFEELKRPLPITGPGDTRPLPNSATVGRLPPPANAPQDAIGRFLTESEITNMGARMDPIRQMIEGMEGQAGARSGPNVYRPGQPAPVERPGMHGSKYRQPIVRLGG